MENIAQLEQNFHDTALQYKDSVERLRILEDKWKDAQQRERQQSIDLVSHTNIANVNSFVWKIFTNHS
jgi:hypothetical protein